MKIHEQRLLDEWKKDCVIDDENLDKASTTIPLLHSKYLELLSIAKKQKRQVERETALIIKQRMEWYNGELTKEEMDELGWKYDPYNGVLVKTKSQKEFYYKTDEVLIGAQNEIENIKDSIEAIEAIIENIRWRNQTIKNAIDWKRFQAGF